MDFYSGVPTNLALNLAFRRQVLGACRDSAEYRHAIFEACRIDPLFFIATFGWLQEVRPVAEWQADDWHEGETTIPFVPRGYQARVIRESAKALGRQDLIVPKSRETGITWIYIALAVWDWRFNGAHIGFVSRDEDSVDTSQGSDSLLGKFQFFLDRLPKWMGCVAGADYTRNLTNHSFSHHESGGNLTGLASGPDIFRGARKKWVLFDEAHFFPKENDYLARDSLVGVTRCRLMVSTLNRSRGASGAFWEAWQDAGSNVTILEIDWKEDSEKARGLYTSEHGRLQLLDTEFWEPFQNEDGSYRHPYRPGETYRFILDGVTRSLYYDYEGDRPGVNRQTLAAELDRDITGATAQLCDAHVLKHAGELARDPVMSGIFIQTDDPYVWEPDWTVGEEAGLWCDLVEGKPSVDEYVMGADVAAGTGGSWSSYSALAVFKRKTGEQVFQWRSNQMNPLVFASLSRFVGMWFNEAYFVPEVNGPLGTLFIEELMRLGYPKVYLQRRGKKTFKETTQSPGYWNNDRGVELLTTLESSIKSGAAKVMSRLCLREMSRYFFKGGELVQASAQSDEDEGAKGRAHGDMAIATAAAWWGVRDLPEHRAAVPAVELPLGSFAWRQEQARSSMRTTERAYWRGWN
jgi:hypothetical protein